VVAIRGVKDSVVRLLPDQVKVSARDAYHRARLRLGNNPLVKPDEHEAFLVKVLPRLGFHDGDPLTYLEFGVYQGATMGAAVRAVDRAGLGTAARFVGFDSFEGLPPGSEDEGWGSGWFVTSRRTTEWNLARQGVESRVELVEGWFSETCTAPRAEELASAHVVMLDCDIFSATDTALRFVEPILADPCVLIFDDWYAFNSDESADVGQVKAFAEFRRRRPGLEVERIGRVGHCGVGFIVAGTNVGGGQVTRIQADEDAPTS
jgi:hypothetical protein